MANKLKNMRLTSVDLVRSGANQEADICLYKSADPTEAAQPPTEAETNIFKRFLNWLRETPTEEEEEPVAKDYTTFDTLNATRENSQKLWQYTEALTCSIRSIQEDHDLDKDEKLEMMQKSLSQFTDAMEELLEALCCVKPSGNALMAKAAPEEEDLSYLFEDLEKSAPDEEVEEFEEVEKYNHNHGADGRFASSGGGGGYKAKTVNHNGFEISNDHPNGGYTASKDGKKLVTREEYYDAKSGTYKQTGKEHLMQFTSVAGAKKMIDYLERSGDLADHLAKSADIDEIEEV